MIIPIKGRIDSNNASKVEAALMAQLPQGEAVVLDAAELQYISSA